MERTIKIQTFREHDRPRKTEGQKGRQRDKLSETERKT